MVESEKELCCCKLESGEEEVTRTLYTTEYVLRSWAVTKRGIKGTRMVWLVLGTDLDT